VPVNFAMGRSLYLACGVRSMASLTFCKQAFSPLCAVCSLVSGDDECNRDFSPIEGENSLTIVPLCALCPSTGVWRLFILWTTAPSISCVSFVCAWLDAKCLATIHFIVFSQQTIDKLFGWDYCCRRCTGDMHHQFC
jgi:hypothetical protein